MPRSNEKRLSGNGSVYKSSKYYYFKITLPDGSRTSKPLSNEDGSRCTTRESALEAVNRLTDLKRKLDEIDSREDYLKQLAENRHLKARITMSLDDAFDIACSKIQRKEASLSTKQTKLSQWNDFCTFLKDKYSITSIADVERCHAEDYIIFMKAHGKWDKNVLYLRTTGRKRKNISYKLHEEISAATINASIKTCRWVFNRLQGDLGYHYEENPFCGIPLLEDKKISREVFSEEELRLIFKNPPRLMKLLFTIGFCTGMRLGDVATLKWKYIKNYASEQYLPSGKPNFGLSEIVRHTRKTNTEINIPILYELEELFLEQWNNSKDSEYIIPEAAEMYLKSPSQLHYRIIRYLQSLGIETSINVNGRARKQSIKDFHSLRHCFCYYAGLRGIPISVVKKIVGHVSEEMTKHYQDHSNREVRRKSLLMMRGIMVFNSKPAPQRSGSEKFTDVMINRISNYIMDAPDEILFKMNRLIDEITGENEKFEEKNMLVPAVCDATREIIDTVAQEIIPIPQPDKESLEVLIQKFNRPRIGQIYNVSETCIRKWLKKYEIVTPKGYRWNGIFDQTELDTIRQMVNERNWIALSDYKRVEKRLEYHES